MSDNSIPVSDLEELVVEFRDSDMEDPIYFSCRLEDFIEEYKDG